MARIGIGGLHHETNSFAPQAATFERFVEADGWPPLLRGEAMFAGSAGINLAITGFIDAARAAGHDLVPLAWANACPSGPVTEDAFERLAAMLLDDLAAAGPLDGLYPRPARGHGHRASGGWRGRAAPPDCAAGTAPADRGARSTCTPTVSEAWSRAVTPWWPTGPTHTSISP